MTDPDNPTNAQTRKLHGRIIDQDGRFLAECWAQIGVRQDAPEGREAQSFRTIEEARSWIEWRSRERGYPQVWMDS